uniref:WD_REPEATS_REGION domain-containing protein n=1 Tax=Macrostomum lignano TaxID=282301 RepID=A0A1I8FR91_9PLAT
RAAEPACQRAAAKLLSTFVAGRSGQRGGSNEASPRIGWAQGEAVSARRNCMIPILAMAQMAARQSLEDCHLVTGQRLGSQSNCRRYADKAGRARSSNISSKKQQRSSTNCYGWNAVLSWHAASFPALPRRVCHCRKSRSWPEYSAAAADTVAGPCRFTVLYVAGDPCGSVIKLDPQSATHALAAGTEEQAAWVRRSGAHASRLCTRLLQLPGESTVEFWSACEDTSDRLSGRTWKPLKRLLRRRSFQLECTTHASATASAAQTRRSLSTLRRRFASKSLENRASFSTGVARRRVSPCSAKASSSPRWRAAPSFRDVLQPGCGSDADAAESKLADDEDSSRGGGGQAGQRIQQQISVSSDWDFLTLFFRRRRKSDCGKKTVWRRGSCSCC